ncbi:unnamed protein product, partial [Iphiclides podalirius]
MRQADGVRGAWFAQIVAPSRAAAGTARVASHSIQARGPRRRRTRADAFERDTIVLHYSVTTRPLNLPPRRQRTRRAAAEHAQSPHYPARNARRAQAPPPAHVLKPQIKRQSAPRCATRLFSTEPALKAAGAATRVNKCSSADATRIKPNATENLKATAAQRNHSRIGRAFKTIYHKWHFKQIRGTNGAVPSRRGRGKNPSEDVEFRRIVKKIFRKNRD